MVEGDAVAEALAPGVLFRALQEHRVDVHRVDVTSRANPASELERKHSGTTPVVDENLEIVRPHGNAVELEGPDLVIHFYCRVQEAADGILFEEEVLAGIGTDIEAQ